MDQKTFYIGFKSKNPFLKPTADGFIETLNKLGWKELSNDQVKDADVVDFVWSSKGSHNKKSAYNYRLSLDDPYMIVDKNKFIRRLAGTNLTPQNINIPISSYSNQAKIIVREMNKNADKKWTIKDSAGSYGRGIYCPIR